MKRFSVICMAVAALSAALSFSSCSADPESEPQVTTPKDSLTALSAPTTIYCTLADGSSKSTCASADGTTYAANAIDSTTQAKIDFVYFNGDHGTSYGIYSPKAVASILTSTFSS